MRALSIKQPFAELIARGEKTIEYRTWKVKPFGDLLVVASKTFHHSVDPNEWDSEELVFGKSVCVVDFHKLTGVEGDYRWHFRDPRRVHPVDVKGYAALYTVDDARIRYVAEGAPRDLARASKLALVADHDHKRRRPYEAALTKAGFEVLTCDDGADAWKLARTKQPWLLVTHFSLASVSGLELYERVRRSKALRSTRVYVVGDRKLLVGVEPRAVLQSAKDLVPALGAD